jgi:hypothetical protein
VTAERRGEEVKARLAKAVDLRVTTLHARGKQQ